MCVGGEGGGFSTCQRAEKHALLLGDATASGMVFRRLTPSSHFQLGQKCFLSATKRTPAEGRGQWVSGGASLRRTRLSTQLLLPRTCLIIERMDSASTADHPTVTAAQLSLLSKAAEPCPQLCRPQTWTQSLGLPVWFPDLRLTTASCPAAAGRSLGVNLDTGTS